MKWITHEHVRADRVTSAWLIRHFVDPQAAFLFAPRDQVMPWRRARTRYPLTCPAWS
jgi:hypothetical protein